MRFFIDTEFIESGRDHPLTLISIGIVSYLGKEFYAVNSEFGLANPWVRANVLPYLGDTKPQPIADIAGSVLEFISKNGLSNPDGTASVYDSSPELWGYYADYDWVVFCQLFGTMMDLPKGYPMYCLDLKQWCDSLGNPKLPAQSSKEHNALNDARWNRQVYEFLKEVEANK